MVAVSFGAVGHTSAPGAKVHARCEGHVRGAWVSRTRSIPTHTIPRVKNAPKRVHIVTVSSGLSKDISLSVDRGLLLKSSAAALAVGASTLWMAPGAVLAPITIQAVSAPTLCFASLCAATFSTTPTVLWMTAEGIFEKAQEGTALMSLTVQICLCVYALGMFGWGSLSRLGALTLHGSLALGTLTVAYAAFKSDVALSDLPVLKPLPGMNDVGFNRQTFMPLWSLFSVAVGLWIAGFPSHFAKFALSDPIISKSSMLWMSLFGSGVTFLGIQGAATATMPSDVSAKVMWSEAISAALSIPIALQALSQQMWTSGGAALLLGAPLICLVLNMSFAIMTNQGYICAVSTTIVDKISTFRRDILSPWALEEKAGVIHSAAVSAGGAAAAVAEEITNAVAEKFVADADDISKAKSTTEDQDSEADKIVDEGKSAETGTTHRPDIEDF